MTVLTFPSNPIVGQQYAAPNGIQYVFDGVKWIVETISSSSEAISNSTQDRIAPMFVDGDNTGITFSYNAATNVMSADVTAINGDRLVNGIHELVLGADGSTTYPDVIKVANTLNGSIVGENGLSILSQNGNQMSMIYNRATILNTDPAYNANVAALFLDGSGATFEINTDTTGKSWHFKTDGTFQLAAGGDIVDSNGVTVLGGTSYNQSLNTTDSVTFNRITSTTLVQTSSETVSPNSVNVPGATPTVVFSAPSYFTSIKLVIAVEGRLDGDGTNVDHTQTCEATIAATYNTAAEPVMSVYGIIYTSPTPLATFTVARNGLTGALEVTAVNSQTTNAMNVRVHAIQFVSRYV